MRRRRVLIVEDDPMVALDLESIVVGAADADVAVATSVQEARRVLGDAVFDAAFLDIDVLDGKTFDLAQQLADRGMPFVFVSGARREDVPSPLRQVPFLPKPYDPQDIERTFLARLAHQG
jgi:DNA-binding NtrC family response regulator